MISSSVVDIQRSRMATEWTDTFSWNSPIKSRPRHSLFFIQIRFSSSVSFHFLQICRAAPRKLVVPGQGARQTKWLKNMHQQQDLSRLTIQVSSILFPFHWFPLCKTKLVLEVVKSTTRLQLRECALKSNESRSIKTCHFVSKQLPQSF